MGGWLPLGVWPSAPLLIGASVSQALMMTDTIYSRSLSKNDAGNIMDQSRVHPPAVRHRGVWYNKRTIL